jgi:hypothetical protein
MFSLYNMYPDYYEHGSVCMLIFRTPSPPPPHQKNFFYNITIFLSLIACLQKFEKNI